MTLRLLSGCAAITSAAAAADLACGRLAGHPAQDAGQDFAAAGLASGLGCPAGRLGLDCSLAFPCLR